MMELLGFHNKQYKEITGHDYDKPSRKRNKKDQFFELHTVKTNIVKEIAQIFIDTVKKTIYHK
jgi:hypothetical protein